MTAAPLLRYDNAPTAADLRQLAQLQQRFGQLFIDLEQRLPQPGAAELPTAYRKRILGHLQRHSPSWREASLDRLPAGVIDNIEPEILRDATAVASDPTVGSFKRRGELRETRRADQSGNETVTFHGDPRSWMNQFCTPSIAAVKEFNVRRR